MLFRHNLNVSAWTRLEGEGLGRALGSGKIFRTDALAALIR